ncbi:MAG: hypothetical protein J5I47_09685 [Vicingus serpentipes]|nr:hypothetical protein [Vicingus serpentipes]
MRLLSNSLRIVVGLVFIASAVAKLFPIEPFELIFIELGISNWLLVPFLSRTIIAMELFLGLCILFNTWFNNIIYYLAQTALFLFTGYLIFILITQGNSADCGCFGKWLTLSPLQSLLKNVLLMVFLFLIKKQHYSSGLKWVFPLVFLISSFVSVFLVNKVGLQNVQGKSIDEPIDLSALPGLYKKQEKVPFQEGKKLVIFLSAHCKHCTSVAYRLAYVVKARHPSNVILVLAALEEQYIQPFFDETGLLLPFIWVDNDSFLQYTGGKIPAFIYLENGILKKRWAGEFVKLDELEAVFEK